jgi:hypothetical protein
MENIPLEIICFYVARPRRSLARKLSPSDKSGAENYICRIHQWHRTQTSFTWINNAKIKKHRPPRVLGSQLHLKFIHLSVLPFDSKPNRRAQALKCNLRPPRPAASSCDVIRDKRLLNKNESVMLVGFLERGVCVCARANLNTTTRGAERERCARAFWSADDS